MAPSRYAISRSAHIFFRVRASAAHRVGHPPAARAPTVAQRGWTLYGAKPGRHRSCKRV